MIRVRHDRVAGPLRSDLPKDRLGGAELVSRGVSGRWVDVLLPVRVSLGGEPALALVLKAPNVEIYRTEEPNVISSPLQQIRSRTVRVGAGAAEHPSAPPATPRDVLLQQSRLVHRIQLRTSRFSTAQCARNSKHTFHNSSMDMQICLA